MQVFIIVKVPRGDAHRQQIAALAVDSVRQAGHQPFLAYQAILDEGLEDARLFMPFVRQHMRTAGLALLFYDPELRGGLIEEGLAFAYQVPVWLFHQVQERVSSSALGCAQRVFAYTDLEDLARQLRVGLADLPEG
ncbi:MAG: hypothetical protein AB1894_20240 [Chloroflexota bacterium]